MSLIYPVDRRRCITFSGFSRAPTSQTGNATEIPASDLSPPLFIAHWGSEVKTEDGGKRNWR